jgi:hypothetical protein
VFPKSSQSVGGVGGVGSLRLMTGGYRERQSARACVRERPLWSIRECNHTEHDCQNTECWSLLVRWLTLLTAGSHSRTCIHSCSLPSLLRFLHISLSLSVCVCVPALSRFLYVRVGVGMSVWVRVCVGGRSLSLTLPHCARLSICVRSRAYVRMCVCVCVCVCVYLSLRTLSRGMAPSLASVIVLWL